MINLKGYNFLFGKKAVSPVIGTILMVAVTVIMAGIVGGFVYQTAKPKIPPTISTSLADDPLRGVDTDAQGIYGNDDATPADTPHNPAAEAVGYGNRVAKLSFEGGQSISIAELSAIVVYTPNDGTEITVILDGVFWGDAITTGPSGYTGNLMAWGTDASTLWLMWADVDGTGDITPGDRLDFFETDGGATLEGVARATDFNVKVLHKATQAFVTDLTIRVY